MSHIRFNHVFVSLLLLAGVCAFLVPMEYTDRARGHLNMAFAPVASPLRHFAEMLTNRFGHRGESGSYPGLKTAPADAQSEIGRLRAAVAALTVQNAELLRQQKSHYLKGDLQNCSVPCRVIGSSASPDVLLLGAAADGVEVGMPVVFRESLVGRVTAAGAGGSQVRLITDRGSRINGVFGRFKDAEFIPIATAPPQVVGDGSGAMAITNLALDAVKDTIRPGDWVVLQDAEDWPLILNGYKLGYVDKIEPQPKAQWYARITVKPADDLLRLREAMVITQSQKPFAAPPRAKTPAAAPGGPADAAGRKTERKGVKR